MPTNRMAPGLSSTVPYPPPQRPCALAKSISDCGTGFQPGINMAAKKRPPCVIYQIIASKKGYVAIHHVALFCLQNCLVYSDCFRGFDSSGSDSTASGDESGLLINPLRYSFNSSALVSGLTEIYSPRYLS